MAKQTFSVGQTLTAAQMTSLQQTAMLGGAASAKTASYTLVAADAGTAISMSNASATTITVNTGLFAAGDTVQITNLGAGVCTITAGTATVNSSADLALAQYESGTLDFTSASAAIFIKGAGAAPVSSSGMTLITTNNFSAVAAANLDNVFSATYLNYQVVVTFSTSANASPDLKLRNAGSNITSGNNYAYVAGPVGGASVAAATGGSAFVGLPNVAGGCEYYITFVITNVFTTKPTFAYGSHGFISGGSKGLYTGGISQDNLSTIDGFSVNVGSGTITGTASVYGLAI